MSCKQIKFEVEEPLNVSLCIIPQTVSTGGGATQSSDLIISNPATESLNGTDNRQNEVNEGFVDAINDLNIKDLQFWYDQSSNPQIYIDDEPDADPFTIANVGSQSSTIFEVLFDAPRELVFAVTGEESKFYKPIKFRIPDIVGTKEVASIFVDESDESLQIQSNASIVLDSTELYITEAASYEGQSLIAGTNGKVVYGDNPASKVEWQNTWTAQTYYENDMVRDGEWTMIANKETTDRAAPQPYGDVLSEFDGDGSGFTTNTVLDQSVIVTGQRYTAVEDVNGWLEEISIYSSVASSTTEVEVWVVADPLGSPVSNFLAKFNTPDIGWYPVAIGQGMIQAGSQFDVFMYITNSQSGSSTFSIDYNYNKTNGDPSSGEIRHQSNNKEIRIHNEDLYGADQSAQLALMQAGDLINAGGLTWTITEVLSRPNGGLYVDVTPQTRVDSDTYSVEFTHFINATIPYAIEAGHYSGRNVKGLYSEIGSYQNIVENENAYGFDIRFQPATISEDWDLVAVNGGSGSSTKQYKAEEISYDNGTSGLTSENVQDAIDELVESGGSSTPEYDYIDFNPLTVGPSFRTNRIWGDGNLELLSYYMPSKTDSSTIGLQQFLPFYNNTGSTITKGTPVSITGYDPNTSIPLVTPTIASDKVLAQLFSGIVQKDVPNLSIGIAARYDTIDNYDTRAWNVNDRLYVAADTAELTNEEPLPPNYSLLAGTVFSSAIDGLIGIEVNNLNHSDTETNLNGSLNGIITQTQEVRFVVETGVIYVEVRNQNDINHDLPFILHGKTYYLNTTTNSGNNGWARSQITAGGVNDSQINFIYVYLNGDTPTLATSTTYTPTDSAWVGICSALDATSTDNDGIFGFQRFNNAVYTDGGDGNFNYITERIRQEGAKYFNGVEPTITIDSGQAPDSVNVTTTAGLVYQLHNQLFESTNGSDYYILNHPTEPYKHITDLNEIDVTANGSAVTDGDRLVITVLGLQNSSGSGDRILINLPTDVYANDQNAINDANGYAITTVPSGSGIGTNTFRICRLVLRYDSNVGGTWTNILGDGEFIDERGQPLGSGGGGSASGGATTQYPDSAFAIYNNTDPTKFMQFDASSITTGATRTLEIPDQDGRIALTHELNTKYFNDYYEPQINITSSVYHNVGQFYYEPGGVNTLNEIVIEAVNSSGEASIKIVDIDNNILLEETNVTTPVGIDKVEKYSFTSQPTSDGIVKIQCKSTGLYTIKSIEII